MPNLMKFRKPLEKIFELMKLTYKESQVESSNVNSIFSRT